MVNYNQLLSMAKKLRAEKEKHREFQVQKDDQKSYLNHLEARRQRLANQLVEMRQIKSQASGQNLLQRAEDAIRVNQYMINEKLSKEIQQKTADIAQMEKVLASPNPIPADLQLVAQKVFCDLKIFDGYDISISNYSNFNQNDELRGQIAQLTEKRALQINPIEDGMALYRQQSLIVSRKKEACAERLNDLRQEMNALESQLQVNTFQPNPFNHLIYISIN